MLRVRMKTHITGYRNGEPWPQSGGHIDLPDHEAADLVANGYAVIVGEATDEPADDGLEGLGVRRLRSLARDAGLELGAGAGKEQLVEALRAHQAHQARQHATALALVQGGPDGGPDSSPAGDAGGPADTAGGSDGTPPGTAPAAAGDQKPTGRTRKRTTRRASS